MFLLLATCLGCKSTNYFNESGLGDIKMASFEGSMPVAKMKLPVFGSTDHAELPGCFLDQLITFFPHQTRRSSRYISPVKSPRPEWTSENAAKETDARCVCVCCWGLLVFCYFVILFLFHFFWATKLYNSRCWKNFLHKSMYIFIYHIYIYISYIRWFRWAWFTTAPNFAHTFVEQCVLYNISFNGWLVG